MTDSNILAEIRALNWDQVESGALNAVLRLAETDDISHIFNSLIAIDRDLLPATLTAHVKKTRPELLRPSSGSMNGQHRNDSNHSETSTTRARRQDGYRGYAAALQRAVEREQARRDNDYTRADRLREELAAEGVTLDDKQHLFTMSSGHQGSYSLQRGTGIHEVQLCCLDREEARRDNDYTSADDIRKQLADLGVNLDDKSHTFRMADGQQGSYDLRMSQGATFTSPAPVRGTQRPATRFIAEGSDFANIEKLCIDRERARKDGDYATADNLRVRLGSLGVALEDRTHTFTTSDGRRGSYDLHAQHAQQQFAQPQIAPGYPQLQFAQPQYGQVGYPQVQYLQPALGYAVAAPSAVRSPSIGGNSKFSGYLKVLQLAREREEMRRNRDYRGADRLRMDLKQMGVECEDAVHTFTMGGGLRGSYDLNADLGFEEIQYVALEREEARKNRNYALSDSLRDWLAQHGVQLDDKTHTFSLKNGSSGSYDLSAWDHIGDDDPSKRRRIASRFEPF